MRADRPAEGGTVFVVSVSGTKYSPASRRDYAAKFFEETSTYEVINVLASEHRLVFRSFDKDGREVDRFEAGEPGRDQARLTPPAPAATMAAMRDTGTPAPGPR